MNCRVIRVALGLLLWSSLAFAQAGNAFVGANDNRHAAGALTRSVLTLNLVAEQALWQPEGPNGQMLTIQAFREESGSLMVPGPLVRVPTGTEIHLSIRNRIAGTTLQLFGMQTHPASIGSAIAVPFGETRQATFQAGAPGTYYYWATTGNRSLDQRADIDSQLGGAFIVDPNGPVADDRVLVIGLYTKPGFTAANDRKDVGVINGRSWPLTDVLDYRTGDTAHWRIINASDDSHAMHLHGMYFTAIAVSDGIKARDVPAADQIPEVTRFIAPGAAFDLMWRAERVGQWLFHCHMTRHMTNPDDTHAGEHADDLSGGMAGIIVGIRVTGVTPSNTIVSSPAPRRFTLHLREVPNQYGNRPGYRIDPEGIASPRVASSRLPGPILVLERGQPVEVTLSNEMHGPTAIHWHGIELDSYFDGVPGWGGTPTSTTPAIQPGRSFIAKFTPPRAGTFIYHQHSLDDTQLSGGLYGPLVVLEPGQQYDPRTDHVFIVGYDGEENVGRDREPIVLNGQHATTPASAPGPVPTRLQEGVANRLRLINITPNNFALTFQLTDGTQLLSWKAIAKDGATLADRQQTLRIAQQLVSVGETYDFEFTPTPGQRLWLNLIRGNGEWVAQTLLVAGP